MVNIININRAIAAYSIDNKLLGIAGYRYENEMMINIKFLCFKKQFGFVKGLVKYAFGKILYNRKPDNKFQILMDGIAVHKDYRGRGIGKLLFNGLEAFAAENNMQSIKLDVIDENPKAKKLYEAIGFEVVSHYRIPLVFKKTVNVSGATTMVKNFQK